MLRFIQSRLCSLTALQCMRWQPQCGAVSQRSLHIAPDWCEHLRAARSKWVQPPAGNQAGIGSGFHKVWVLLPELVANDVHVQDLQHPLFPHAPAPIWLLHPDFRPLADEG